MGTLLWSPNYIPSPRYNFPRSYIKGFALFWLPGLTVLAAGNPFIFEEHTYGGYHLHLKFRDNFWDWNSNRYTLDYIVEDYYQTPPGSSTPETVGLLNVTQTLNIDHPSTHIFFQQAFGSETLWFDLPPAPPSYWLPPLQ
jgi:hypothetical protein